MLGTRTVPKITYVNGDLRLDGNTTGAGILIVDGTLEMDSNTVFEGLVLLGICPTCPGRYDGADSNAGIFGFALVMANPTSSHSGESRVDLDSDAGIFYCTDALAYAGALSGGGLTLTAWHTF